MYFSSNACIYHRYSPKAFGVHLGNLWQEQRRYPLRKRVENWIKQKNKKWARRYVGCSIINVIFLHWSLKVNISVCASEAIMVTLSLCFFNVAAWILNHGTRCRWLVSFVSNLLLLQWQTHMLIWEEARWAAELVWMLKVRKIEHWFLIQKWEFPRAF